MTTFASRCSVASPSALDVLARFDMGTLAGILKLLLRLGGSILDMLALTGLGLRVAVVEAVEVEEGVRSRCARLPAEFVGDDRPSLITLVRGWIAAAGGAAGVGEGKGKEAAVTVL